MSPKTQVAAQEGWFTLDGDAPALLGSRCLKCATVAFPKQTAFCPNPDCAGTNFDEVALSRRGRIWSYTDARYEPPSPYVAADPYEPFCLAAVELAEEKMVVLGQVIGGITAADLAIGMDVELVLDTLYEDDDNEYVVWKWQPVASGTSAQGTTGA